MIIAGSVLIGILQTIIICSIWKKYNIFSAKYKERKSQMIFGCLLVVSVVLNGLLLTYQEEAIICINIFVLYTLLSAIAGIDLKTKKIPNKILAVGIGIRIGMIAIQAVLYTDTVKLVLLNSGTGFLFGLFFLLLLSFISKHGIGYGDVKLFAWLGLCVGLADVYNILFYSVFVAAVVGTYLLLIKRKSKKTEMPFGPFVWLGTYIMLIFNLI